MQNAERGMRNAECRTWNGRMKGEPPILILHFAFGTLHSYKWYSEAADYR
jgi:hypothetical protein